MSTRRNTATTIAPSAYPAILRGADAAAFSRLLRGPEGKRRATSAIASQMKDLRLAVLEYVGTLESAWKSGDEDAVCATAHEIRGLAETAGLAATGRIADGLYKYLDTVKVRGGRADASVIALHIDSISRAAHAEDETTKLGNSVIAELSTLVAHKLNAVNDLERTAAPFTC